jgi:hypothetical protein
LDNLEQFMISASSTMPAGYVVGDVSSPQPLEVGAGKYLTADLQISPTTPTKEKPCQQQ